MDVTLPTINLVLPRTESQKVHSLKNVLNYPILLAIAYQSSKQS